MHLLGRCYAESIFEICGVTNFNVASTSEDNLLASNQEKIENLQLGSSAVLSIIIIVRTV